MDTRSYAFLFAALAAGVSHGQDIRSATADNLNLPGAWNDGSAPVAADTATWNATSTLANTLGANLTWGGLNVSAASGAVSISGANSLVAGAINLGATSLSVQTNAANSSFNFSSLSGSGNLTIANGAFNLGTTNLNTANALNFNGTLSLRGGNVATGPGAVGGSFFYLGRTGITQAAGTAFALDTGTAANNGKDVILDGGAWNNQTIHLTSLSGFGSLRRDSGGASLVSLDVNQAIDTTFNGLVLSHTGGNNVDIRHINFAKSGAGTLTLAGIVGKQTQSTGANDANVNLTVSGGTLVLAANNTRTGTVTVGTGSTLQVGNGGGTGTIGAGEVTNEGSIVFDHGSGATPVVGNAFGGSGTLLKKGAGALVLNGSLGHTGNTTVQAGTLRIQGSSTSPVVVQSGATFGAGTHAAIGTAILDKLTLESGSSSTFRIAGGGLNDMIFVDGNNGLNVAASHVISPVVTGTLATDETVTLIDYVGTLGGSFANFQLAPNTRFQLVHNTADTSIDLKYIGGTLVWTGANGGAWETNGAVNWTLGGSPTPFFGGDNVVFPDGASTGTVALAGVVAPGSTTFENSSLAYTLTGTAITTGTLTKRGTANVTLAMPATYTGATVIEEGTLTAGDGTTNGEIGKGAVEILEGATLRIHRNGLLDYKTDARLRTVSGNGDIVLDGGATLFNYTGAGTGFSDANSWSSFGGNLKIIGGSEFQTIRNGATAMGLGNIVLGDGSSSGKLSQIEGSWSWTNAIQLVGADNRILNRSGAIAGGRTLKLQGVISGSGGLTFEDPTAAMTGAQLGFILTGENTLNGTLTIPANVPVRVGGIPGNTDVNQSGGGEAGTLGSATVANEGLLTFSRTDVHTVANTISGAGQAFIGLSTGTPDQVVTYTATKSYTGVTTVRSGTLLVNTALPASAVSVEAAGKLGGNGTLGSAVTIGGTLAPGDGVGTLTANAGVRLQAGSRFAWEIADWNGSAGTGYDRLATSALDIGATTEAPLTIVITPSSLVNFTEAPKSFMLATTTGGITGLDPGEITVDASAFTGGGTWSVQAVGNNLVLSYALGNAYSAWESANGISGAGADADSDGDGIDNGIEFLIGGDPSGPASDSNALLPVITSDATYLTFTFRRTDEAAAFGPLVQYSTSLGTWEEAQSGEDGVIVEETNNGFGAGIDRVSVKIPRTLAAPGSKLFARLMIELP